MGGSRGPRRGASRGFTFTELAIILVIMALLAVFGVPALLQYSMRSRIVTGQTALRQVAHLEGQWFEDHHGYASLADLGYPVDSSRAAIYVDKDGSIAGHASDSAIYRITLKLGNPTSTAPASYLLSAEPMNEQAKDTRCGTLSLASTGQVGATGGDGEAACWRASGWLPSS